MTGPRERAPEARSALGEWLDVYEAAYQDPPQLSQLACPACGARALSMVFVADRTGDGRATVAFWCGHCWRGLPPNTSVVPPGASAVVRGRAIIPDYRPVPDGR